MLADVEPGDRWNSPRSSAPVAEIAQRLDVPAPFVRSIPRANPATQRVMQPTSVTGAGR